MTERTTVLRAFRCGKAVSLALIVAMLQGCLVGGSRTPDASLDVTAKAYNISPDFETVRVGRLQFVSGIELTSDDHNFGGYSGLALMQDGTAIMAVSDRGHWFAADLVHSSGRLKGITGIRVGKFTGGEKLFGIGRGDAEGLALWDNRFYVPFEGTNTILSYDAGTGTPGDTATPVPVPAKLLDAPRNKGIEAIAAFGSQQLLVLRERSDETDIAHISGWVIEDQGRFTEFRYPKSGKFHPSDATWVEGDGIYVLERHHSKRAGSSMRIVRINETKIEPDSLLTVTELAVAGRPLELDNMEGLAGHVGADGQTMLYVISDNNFSGGQRTLLLQFAVLPAPNGPHMAAPAR